MFPDPLERYNSDQNGCKAEYQTREPERIDTVGRRSRGKLDLRYVCNCAVGGIGDQSCNMG